MGYDKAEMRDDNEGPIRTLVDAVVKEAGEERARSNTTPRYSSQSLGSCRRKRQRLAGKWRTLSVGLSPAYGVEIGP
eukprot:3603799-Alexandrium_andersonii.AAC.1